MLISFIGNSNYSEQPRPIAFSALSISSVSSSSARWHRISMPSARSSNEVMDYGKGHLHVPVATLLLGTLRGKLAPYLHLPILQPQGRSVDTHRSQVELPFVRGFYTHNCQEVVWKMNRLSRANHSAYPFSGIDQKCQEIISSAAASARKWRWCSSESVRKLSDHGQSPCWLLWSYRQVVHSFKPLDVASCQYNAVDVHWISNIDSSLWKY